ncbi:MAG: thioredoxin [candidate division NC10 bacterium RIFCSPLOWO2_12_FULL_66_18]|jgi:thioredoxin 1|nr:MAG: thioredoxin [candidate division NC10 bacterium RIFCSPLOWO2_02_FULL_66_22]OGB95601.1 MAG: thioredoxin [candidate division NC10 bacterium RIFCSPLOWO2_12_FULL_66_18]
MAPGKILTLTDADFDAQVKAQPLIVVDFWAEWCGPCRMVAPVLEELANEYSDRLTVGKVNVDENRQTAARFGVRSIPTLMFFRDGSRADQVIGAHPKATIKAKIDQLLDAH